MSKELYLKWLEEWVDGASKHNSKGYNVYKKAYKSLKENPYPFTHPSELMMLEGIGEKLCKRLTEKMKEYCEENGLEMPKRAKKRKNSAVDGGGDDGATEESGPSPVKKKRVVKTKPYVPKLRSGAYALLLGLATLDEDSRSGITKPDLIELAQPDCDSSFTVPTQTNKFFTAWNSMKTLVEKDLVYEKGRPKRYYLSEDGWEVARRIKKTNNGEINDGGAASDDDSLTSPVRVRPPPFPGKQADLVPQGEILSSAAELPAFTPTILRPGSFTVEMVLDIREIRTTKDRDYVQNELVAKGVKPIMRAMELGDITWIAKVHNEDGEGGEILLDYIVERKRLDDLVGSIKDGRFHEQKFRLGRSGVKNVIYIIEEFSMSAENFQKYDAAVHSAIASTQVVDGYFVKKTLMIDESIRYLVNLTKTLKDKYERQPLHVIPTSVLTTGNYLPLLSHLRKTEAGTDYHISYAAFASMSSKSDTLTLRDIYLKMLMCTRGVTGEKVLEIQKRWKTPIELVEAYQQADRAADDTGKGRKKKMALISDQMGNLVGRKKIAKALSVKVAEVWGDAIVSS